MKQQLKKIGLPLGIILGAVVMSAVMISSKKPPEKKEEDQAAPLVQVVDVEKQDISYTIKSQGTVRPRTQTTLSTQVSGKVLYVADAFIEGGFFNKGDLLIKLDPADYQTDLKSAESNLARANAALEEEVARGKVAAEEWKSVENSVAPELGLRKPQLARELANVKSAEAMLERAQRNLERTEIRAPYDGLVKSKMVDLGQFVGIGAGLGEVYATDIAEVRIPLSNVDLAYLTLPAFNSDKANKPVVSLSAFVAGKARTWQAYIDRSEGVIDSGSRVVYAVAKVEDPYQRINPNNPPLSFGQFVSAQIIGNTASGIVKLPRNFLVGSDRVMVVDDHKIEMRPVNIVRTVGDTLFIDAGLNEGERITDTVLSNPYDGMTVKIVGEDNVNDVTGDDQSATEVASISNGDE